LVRATPRSEPIWSDIVAAMMRVRTRAAEGLSPEELALARKLLAKMCENLGGLPAAPAEAPPAHVAGQATQHSVANTSS
jgi:hypothetical protein